jgi:hypothetical protein
LPPRDLASLLDRRTHKTANIVIGTVHKSVGLDLTDVTMVGSDQHMLVTSTAGDKSWPPGTQVQISQPDGTHGKSIIGNPPPGSGGAAGFTKRVLPAPPKPGKRYVGYYMDVTDDVILAWVYLDGVYQSDLEILEFSDLLDFSAIAVDPAGKVQPGSVAFFSGDPPTTPKVLHVWDPNTGTVYDHAAASGHILSSCCWMQGWIYWFDSQDHSDLTTPYNTVATLYKARADFSGISAVGTITIPVPGGLISAAWELQSLQLSTVAAETQIIGLDDVNHEVTFTYGLRIALGGTADSPTTESVKEFGIPESGGGSFRARGAGADVSIMRRDAAIGANYDQLWPVTGPWTMQAYINCATSTDLASAITYGVPDTGTGIFAIFAGPSVAPFPDSPKAIPVAKHPTVMDYPTYMVPGY